MQKIWKKAKKAKNTKRQKVQKMQKTTKKCKKNIVAVVVDLVLLLQIYFHAKSGGPSLEIDWVTANLVQIKKGDTDTLTDWLISPLYSSEILIIITMLPV